MVWGLFISEFLIPLVTNEGARAYDFLVGGKKKTPPVMYVDNFLTRIQPSARDKMKQVLYGFLSQDKDENIKAYFLKYIDVYFLNSASGLPERVIKELAELNKGTLEFAIFVDTNLFIQFLDFMTTHQTKLPMI